MATAENFDLIVIGSGPAGYAAAIKASQLGLKTICIEKRKTLGGTCLNIGCIPSKALLESSENYSNAKHKFLKHGIIVGDLQVDLPAMMKRKDTVVRQLTTGIAGLFKKYKVESAFGQGRFIGKQGELKQVEVVGESGSRLLQAPRVIIATGSEPVELPFLKFDEKKILSSTGALELKEIPRHFVVVGGGIIGLEMGSVWGRLGAKVTVIEFQNRLTPGLDAQMSEELRKTLIKQGFEFKLGHKCLGATPNGQGLSVQIEEIATGTQSTLEADCVLVATGRRPFTQNLGLETVGLSTDQSGKIAVGAQWQTSSPGIFAVGDVIDGPMLAHKATEEGVACAESMTGRKPHINYWAIPNVLYTWPELAAVGMTEEEARARGLEVRTSTFPYSVNGRAKAMEETEGLVKIVGNAKTGDLLGLHILGARAGEMIHEGAVAIEFGAKVSDLGNTSHAHPTLGEIIKEAALSFDKRQIHL